MGGGGWRGNHQPPPGRISGRTREDPWGGGGGAIPGGRLVLPLLLPPPPPQENSAANNNHHDHDHLCSSNVCPTFLEHLRACVGLLRAVSRVPSISQKEPKKRQASCEKKRVHHESSARMCHTCRRRLERGFVHADSQRQSHGIIGIQRKDWSADSDSSAASPNL